MATDNQASPTMINSHPTSPPMTPGSLSQHRFPPQTLHTSPIYKRMGIFTLVSTPPLEFIEPIGQGHHFKFTRPQSLDLSSRGSVSSGRGCVTSPDEDDDDDIDIDEEEEKEEEDEDEEEDEEDEEDEDEEEDDDEDDKDQNDKDKDDEAEQEQEEGQDEVEIDGVDSGGGRGRDSENNSEQDSEQEIKPRKQRPLRRTELAQFILEELHSDPGYDCDMEIVRPDHYEDAKSDRSGTRSEVFARLKELQLEEDTSDEEEKEERERRYRQKKKRWSAGVFKRSHSQSVEGDSSYSDNDPLDDVDPSARRLRRRVRGPCDRRGSLIFEDRGFANTNNIAEVDEPDDEGRVVMHSQGPPSIPSDDAFTLDELPFWEGGDLMEVEFESE